MTRGKNKLGSWCVFSWPAAPLDRWAVLSDWSVAAGFISEQGRVFWVLARSWHHLTPPSSCAGKEICIFGIFYAPGWDEWDEILAVSERLHTSPLWSECTVYYTKPSFMCFCGRLRMKFFTFVVRLKILKFNRYAQIFKSIAENIKQIITATISRRTSDRVDWNGLRAGLTVHYHGSVTSQTDTRDF